MTAMQPNVPSPATFAESARALITEDWRAYRAFGMYWYFVKALLRRFYDRHQMPMIGDYEDPDVIALMPTGLSAVEMIQAATAEYQDNAATRMWSNVCEDGDGESFTLIDPDMPG
jgi:hypothetical protein